MQWYVISCVQEYAHDCIHDYSSNVCKCMCSMYMCMYCTCMCVCACSVVCYICILNMCCVCACVLLCIRSIPYKGYYVSMCVKPILRQYCAVLISVRIISMYSRMRVRMCLSLAYDRERRFCASLISSGLDSRTCLHRTRITQAH